MLKKLKQNLNSQNYETKGFGKISVSILISIVFMASCLTVYESAVYFIAGGDDTMVDDIIIGISDSVIDYLDEYYIVPEDQQNDCNVAGIELHGGLVTYITNENLDEAGYPTADETASENILFAIKEAEKDNNIKAIILEIDSFGGSPVAAEEVANALKQAKKPTVAMIRDFGISAAYYAATGADIIFASANSDVGSIGVTMSYLDNVKKNQKDGLTYNQLSSGKFKDMFNLDKSLTVEESQLIMRDVEILCEKFIQTVAENRNLDIEKVRQLADGSSMLGQMALENGLIDRIGGFHEVGEYVKEIIDEEMEVCW